MNQFKLDQFAAANEAVIGQFAHFAQLSLANLEKFAAIGIDAARDSVEQATAHAASLAGAKDVHEVIALNSAAFEPVLKRAYSYSRTVYETAAETNAEVKKVFEKQASDLNKSAVSSMEEAFKYAPAGSEAYVGNLKSALAAAQNAYNNLASINKQLVESVEKSVEQNVATVKAAAAPKARRTTKRK
ncbi:MAG TPA: phasin family protein [Usitatibacteraceae bacterium]|nr:phasin family protein [Usitatibacteraceae bacterium]